MDAEPRIVCLGGGVGSVQLLRGLRHFSHHITVVVSMADDGGSAGRLRRLYSIPPPGDLINCLAALSNAEPLLKELLTFRFKGRRWGRDDSLGGQKMGNLILVALAQITGDFNSALDKMQKIFRSHGVILPATNENVSIWAETIEGKQVKGEINIDLGRYSGKREIARVHLDPKDNSSPKKVIDALKKADIIVAGPGDLYTTILPVLMVRDIQKILKTTKAETIFVVNIANKPFETPNYQVSDFLDAIKRHLGFFPFKKVLVNTNHTPIIPKKLKYSYVPVDEAAMKSYNSSLVTANLVNEEYPLYHDPDKVAKKVMDLTGYKMDK